MRVCGGIHLLGQYQVNSSNQFDNCFPKSVDLTLQVGDLVVVSSHVQLKLQRFDDGGQHP